MKKRLLVLIPLFVVLLVSAYTVPVIPDQLPEDVWKEEEFSKLKPRLKAASEKLNRMTFELTEAGYDPPRTYNLVGKYGNTTNRRALLGSWSSGHSIEYTFAFGTWVLPSVPHLNYDEETGIVRITPKNCEGFLEWVDEATEYPDPQKIGVPQGRNHPW